MFPARESSPLNNFTIDTSGYYGASGVGVQTLASAVFPTANKVLYIPFRIPTPVKVLQLYVVNGGTVSGNVDIGIYSRDGTKIVSSGSTAQASINVRQLFNITDTLLGRGVFYLGLTLSNTTGTFSRSAIPLGVLQLMGCLTETTGGFGLPANATFGTYVDAYFPQCGLLAQSVM
jgi:hypothetical protein